MSKKNKTSETTADAEAATGEEGTETAAAVVPRLAPLGTNVFMTLVTACQPFANNRGQTEGSRTKLQTLKWRGQTRALMTDACIKNTYRDTLARRGLPCNRVRLHNQTQPTVTYQTFFNAGSHIDDFLMGYMTTDDKEAKAARQPAKRTAVLDLNLAVSLAPYGHEAVLRQAPEQVGPVSPRGASLLQTEVVATEMQFPLAVRSTDLKEGPREWTLALFETLADPDFRNNAARSLYDLSPRSVVARLTRRATAGFDPYGFQPDGSWGELSRLRPEDLPPGEFWLGGEVVRRMDVAERERLAGLGVTLFDNPGLLLRALGPVLYDSPPAEAQAHG